MNGHIIPDTVAIFMQGTQGLTVQDTRLCLRGQSPHTF